MMDSGSNGEGREDGDIHCGGRDSWANDRALARPAYNVGARDSLETASCANRRQVCGQQIQEHSADCARLKMVLGESKVARLAPRAVFSHRKKTRLGGHFHP
jgi:hypothetical protein